MPSIDLTHNSIWQAFTALAAVYATRIPVCVILFALFWVGGIVAANLITRLGRSRDIDPNLVGFLGRAAKIGMIVFGAVTALGTLGVNVTALVAGLGLTGFALGFAVKDIISNALAGILIIIYKPFEHNDHIKVGSLEGNVVKVDLRYTVLLAEGKTIFVPNSMLFTGAVIVTGEKTSSSAESVD